jgi:hypothetical protein
MFNSFLPGKTDIVEVVRGARGNAQAWAKLTVSAQPPKNRRNGFTNASLAPRT